MKHRPLGSTGLTVSAIGFGGWGIGGRTTGSTSYGDTDDSVSRRALARAFDRGITFFDTSPAYGDGRSERLIGEVFRGRRDRVVIATKAGYQSWTAAPDYSPAAIRTSVEGSLGRLAADHVDLLQLHNAPAALLRARPEIVGALRELLQQGKIRAWGLSAKSPEEGVAAVREFGAGVVQVNLNLLDVRAVTAGLAAAALAAGAGLIARTPLCFGFLSGKVSAATRFSAGDHRAAWSGQQRARWQAGADMVFSKAVPASGADRTHTALRFCLSVPAVASVIPGILTPDEAAFNAAAGDLPPLEKRQFEAVLALNREHQFFLRS
jgi:aryl-alcohol dehydrogenase-like predicted oxidoreductase